MSSFLNAQELADLLDISVSSAYGFIRQMNAELSAQGYLTIRGKIPASYALRRFFIEQEQTEAGEEAGENGRPV